MEKSLGGAGTPQPTPAGPPPDAQPLKKGDWGKLPKQIAEQLTKGQADSIPDEYRQAVETYYRVVAEKSRKP